jgi:hypothetical protein
MRIISLYLCSLLAPVLINAQTKTGDWDGFYKDSTVSSLDGAVQYLHYYITPLPGKQPLVIALHQWSSNYKNYRSPLAAEVKNRKWNFVYPDFRGANKHPKACCSPYAISDINDAIDWAIKNLPVDIDSIYLVGASGGGYTALCTFMQTKHPIMEYNIWVPITDLARWYYEVKVKGSKYADDILKCTGNDSVLNINEARNRSPLYWKTPVHKLEKSRLKIYTGIHDGHTGSVFITHSILFYNKVVSDMGGNCNDKVSLEDATWMLTTRTPPRTAQKTNSNNRFFYTKSFRNISISIFEGGHEILYHEVLPK